MESSSFSGDSTSAGSEREEGRWVVPLYLHWSTEEVAEWVESLGFNQYKECFTSNAVTGRRLIWIDASTLPRMGITDWKHIQFISAKVRELLQIEEPYWNRSITVPHRSELGMFLEKKSFTGRHADKLKFEPKSEKT